VKLKKLIPTDRPSVNAIPVYQEQYNKLWYDIFEGGGNMEISSLEVSGNVQIDGNLNVDGTLTANGGTITIGDGATDNLVLNADVNSHVIPNTTNTYDLGSSGQVWRTLYGTTVKLGNGSAAAPSHTFGGQVDMGMYLASASELAFSTAGVFRGRFSATGGLEVASPGITNTAVSASRVIKKPSGTTVAANSGTTLTADMMLSGYVMVTGTTGSLELDTVANLTSALGTSPEGTTFDFTLNTLGATPMTAGNTVTLTAPANCTFMKQFNTTDAATDFVAVVTATAGVHLGTFRVTYDTATTIVVQRIG